MVREDIDLALASFGKQGWDKPRAEDGGVANAAIWNATLN
jgi:hypothetical protein